MSEIDTTNKWMVGAGLSGNLKIMRPPGALTPDDALLLAAWLVAMAGKPREDFLRVLDAVENT